VATSNLEIVISAKDHASGILGGIGGAIGKIGKVVAGMAIGAAVAGITAMGAALALSVKEAMEAQEVQAQLEAVIKSTGGVAGWSATQANALSDSLMGITRYSDETITSAQSLLLTFTNIGANIFPQATEAILNVSTALGQDLSTSAIQIGKALNDPIDGLTTLRRVGIQFSDSQEEMIKKLVESGDLLGAQQIILAELERQFGGAAIAAGQTLPGQLDILRNSLLNVAEGVGTILIPILTTTLQSAIPYIMQFANAFATFLTTDRFQQWITTAGTYISTQLIPKLVEVGTWLTTNIPLAIQAVASWWTNTLIPALQNFGVWWTTTGRPALADLWLWLSTNIPPAIAALSTFWTTQLQPALAEFGVLWTTTLYPALSGLFNWLSQNQAQIESISNVLNPFQVKMNIISDWLTLHMTPAFEKLKTTLFSIKTAFMNVSNQIALFINKLKLIKLPDWLTPGSPTPFEMGLVGIIDTMGTLSDTMIPKLARSLGTLQNPISAVPGMGTSLTGGNLSALPTAGGMAGAAGGTTIVYSPVFSAASMREFEQQLVPLIDRQMSLNQRRRV